MAAQPQLLCQKAVGSTFSNFYEVASTYTILKEVLVCNTHTEAARITIHLVPTGHSPGVDNVLLNSSLIGSNETVIFTFSTVLPVGMQIVAKAEVDLKICMTITGVEVA